MAVCSLVTLLQRVAVTLLRSPVVETGDVSPLVRHQTKPNLTSLSLTPSLTRTGPLQLHGPVAHRPVLRRGAPGQTATTVASVVPGRDSCS